MAQQDPLTFLSHVNVKIVRKKLAYVNKMSYLAVVIASAQKLYVKTLLNDLCTRLSECEILKLK